MEINKGLSNKDTCTYTYQAPTFKGYQNDDIFRRLIETFL